MAVSVEQVKLLQNNQLIRDTFNIQVKWRILTTKGGVARIVAYQDARDVQTVLDSIIGSENWTNEPRNFNNKMYMSIGINIKDEGWVYKADVGVESDIEGVKGEASDAFKRAAVMWGIFRDLYSMDYIILKTNGKEPVTPEGQVLSTPQAISAYCNGISKPLSLLQQFYRLTKESIKTNDKVMESLEVLVNYTKQNFK